MTIGDRIRTSGKVLGRLALLGMVVYEARKNGEYRRVRDQRRGLRQFQRSEREAAHVARAAAEIEQRFRVAPTPLTKERQAPTLRVTSSPAALRDFLRWAERRRNAG